MYKLQIIEGDELIIEGELKGIEYENLKKILTDFVNKETNSIEIDISNKSFIL